MTTPELQSLRADDQAARTATTGQTPTQGEAESIVSRQIDAMVAAWERGQRPRIDDFLAEHPELSDEEAVRLIFEEACLREDAGEDEDSVSADILERFPRWRSKLALLLECNKLLSVPPASEFPEVGEEIGDFRLLAELGRGALGKTFLAAQRSLGDRPVVLKITPLGHHEHLSLARLQHMHIVPLYFEQVLPDRNLRILGMPYLGGTTLQRINDALRALPVEQRTGRLMLEAMDRSAPCVSAGYGTAGPIRKYLGQASYVQAVCWIGACLADALQYAHDRGLVHLDVKPSNVLVAGDGQPMLLDFHLAQGPIGLGLAPPPQLGGTREYLSPEQSAAMDEVRRGEPVASAVDARSDLYSLGLLLYVTLGGDAGDGGSRARRPLDRCNSRVPSGLSDIIEKCLAVRPCDRYPSAASLAQDLRRHLSDQPLRGVRNRSVVERWRKWRRRRPAALGRATFRLALIAGVAGLVVFSVVRSNQKAAQVEIALHDGLIHLESHRYLESTRDLERGLKLVRELPDHDRRKPGLHAQLKHALKQEAITELHDVVDQLRFRFGVQRPSEDQAERLFTRGRDVWNARALIADADDAPLPPATQLQVRNDLLDLVAICAELRLSARKRGDAESRLRDAYQMLVDAKRQFGINPALYRDLESYAKALGLPSPGAGSPPAPKTAWEHYNLGLSELGSHEYARALDEFRRSTSLQPGEFWSYFFQAVCTYRLERYQDSIAAMTICVALAPRIAECYYNRAKGYDELGDKAAALADYSRALELNPVFTDAAINRGVIAYNEHRYTAALEDLRRAWTSAGDAETRGLIQYNMALVHIARKDHAKALASLQQATACGNEAARNLLTQLAPK